MQDAPRRSPAIAADRESVPSRKAGLLALLGAVAVAVLGTALGTGLCLLGGYFLMAGLTALGAGLFVGRQGFVAGTIGILLGLVCLSLGAVVGMGLLWAWSAFRERRSRPGGRRHGSTRMESPSSGRTT